MDRDIRSKLAAANRMVGEPARKPSAKQRAERDAKRELRPWLDQALRASQEDLHQMIDRSLTAEPVVKRPIVACRHAPAIIAEFIGDAPHVIDPKRPLVFTERTASDIEFAGQHHVDFTGAGARLAEKLLTVIENRDIAADLLEAIEQVWI